MVTTALKPLQRGSSHSVRSLLLRRFLATTIEPPLSSLNFYTVSEDELQATLKGMKQPSFRVKQIREWVEKAGFDGYNEVEVFSERLWAQDQKLYLEDIKKAYLNYI